MAAFRFEALRGDGKRESGYLDAESMRQARSMLRERGLICLQLERSEQSKAQSRDIAWFAGRINAASLANATRQLASLVAARLPLERALLAVVEQAEEARLRDLIAAVRSEVVAGQSLAKALAAYPRDFPETYRAVIAAGEQSGDLAPVLLRLASDLERSGQLTQKIGLALVYPAIVSLVAIAVVIALMSTVVPQVVQVFASTRQTLPWLTQVLITASDAILNHGFHAAVFALAASLLFFRAMKEKSFRRMVDRRLIALPVLGRLIIDWNTARFASTLAMLVASGVPLMPALVAAASTVGNLVMREAVILALERVREGMSLSKALADAPGFPPLLKHLIASGEATGDLDKMLDQAAIVATAQAERRALLTTSILEPLMILVMGAIVLTIVLAVMMPILDMNALVR
ncbi:MAG: type II secretion system protein GspF [Betaproteobacteria bacterium]|nr:type II secretion system protein GspF [Betaproteobacteria bacterium]HAB48772.1 type II secretion system protein GspF [Lautropia sp.]